MWWSRSRTTPWCGFTRIACAWVTGRALLLALTTHYPAAARSVCAAPAIDALVPRRITGRDIKLSRIARARLSEYL